MKLYVTFELDHPTGDASLADFARAVERVNGAFREAGFQSAVRRVMLGHPEQGIEIPETSKR